jgi:hypothetical protein
MTAESEADDRMSDIARACWSRRNPGLGGVYVSAEIIQFIPRPKLDAGQTDFPTIVFLSALLDDRAIDHADTAPSEYVQPDWYEK